MTMIASTISEVCSEGTSPMALEIYRQTRAFGNTFVFLVGGMATDYTVIGLLWKNLRKKTGLWMLVINIPQIIFFGWIFNRF
ncbi:MAG: hypothetical protein EXS63_01810 [Candidatus Omnitrophica bacterium]|nr:hypothetical protein [Candidatus Omnitrophota bacterium]